MGASCCGLLEEVIDTRFPSAHVRPHPMNRSSSRRFGCQNPIFAPAPTAHPATTPQPPGCRRCRQQGMQCARSGDGDRIGPWMQACTDCQHSFCSDCLQQTEACGLLCQTCNLLYATSFSKDNLMRAKVKDLRDYLSLHGIAMETCREKEELVELVLQHRRPVAPVPATDEQVTSPVRQTEPASTQPFIHVEPQPEVPTTTSPGSYITIFHCTSEPSLSFHRISRGRAEPGHENRSKNIDLHLSPHPAATACGMAQMPVGLLRISLSDLSMEDDAASLTVREMKTLLRRNFVDYKGCCERWELEERVRRLYRDTRQLDKTEMRHQRNGIRLTGGPPDENTCKICMDAPIDCVLLECGHMVTCTKCGKRMSECPICRQYVVRAVHVFRT
uniref:Ring finger and FYVE-like domain containing E3 ubiquitin protein ligase n=1 Tax=Petromyzon marinus TaxID=7757 RepID=S4RIQ7_PETMA